MKHAVIRLTGGQPQVASHKWPVTGGRIEIEEESIMKWENKLVAVMNEKIDSGIIMNALAHMALGLGAVIGPEALELIDYRDGDGGCHPHISKMPFIILKANSNKIRRARELAQAESILVVDFTDAMRIGTYQEQLEKSLQTREEDLTYLGLIMYGPWDRVCELTQKFSLWK